MHQLAVTGHTLVSSEFDVGILMYRKTIKVKELDTYTKEYNKKEASDPGSPSL